MRQPLRTACLLLISLGILGAPRAVAHFRRDALTRDGPAWLAQLLLGISSSGDLVFDELIHDFGIVSEGTEVQYVFRCENRADHPISIERVKISCGCNKTSFSKDPIPSGGEGLVEVVFESQGRLGRQHKPVTIVTSEGEGARLLITADVRSLLIVDKLAEPDPRTSMLPGEDYVYDFRLGPGAGHSLDSARLDNDRGEFFVAEILQEEAGTYFIRATVTAPAEVRTVADWVVVVASVDSEEVRVPIKVQVFVDEPLRVNLGRLLLQPGGPSVSLIVKVQWPGLVRITEVESTDPALAVHRSIDRETMLKLDVSLKDTATLGEEARIIVHTDNPNVPPLTIPVEIAR